MEPFTIQSIVPEKAYNTYVTTAVLNHLPGLLYLIFGLICWVLAVVVCDSGTDLDVERAGYLFLIGLLFIQNPVNRILKARRAFKKEPIPPAEMTFLEDRVIMKTRFEEGFIKWDGFIAGRETAVFLILYQTRQGAYFLLKSLFTPEQLAFIKSRVRTVAS
ncbi:YcxB family protein [Niabella beijingensis]|uniref:YcxB family protein n=1 Tax=Niabella beijingensis TaxID=2872700 RepID=UPI001CBD8A65|nr:YcxB family protein [Niabella beijingensis]MBZ4189686.1 YcxB family protein [Niabella beijingensis]